jgi:hypothetical protein
MHVAIGISLDVISEAEIGGGVPVQLIELGLEVGGPPHIVVVEEGDDFAACFPDAPVACGRCAARLLRRENVRSGKALGQAYEGVIGRRVVHDDDLEVAEGLRLDAGQCSREALPSVPRRNDHGHAWCHRVRSSRAVAAAAAPSLGGTHGRAI